MPKFFVKNLWIGMLAACQDVSVELPRSSGLIKICMAN